MFFLPVAAPDSRAQICRNRLTRLTYSAFDPEILGQLPAKDWPADLIVIGSHGRSGMRRALLGSVAEGVMRNATCPVLVVRAQS